MRAHTKQRIFNILAILTMAVILTCIFAACGDVGAQDPSNDNGSNGNNNIATPYIRFVVDDVEYSKVQTKGNEIIVMPVNPTKDGYTFVGWFWDNGTWDRPFTANSMLNEPLKNDMTVYAYFEKMHEHTYSKDWAYDATNHWHASTCGHSVVDGKASHTFNDVNICTICGYKDVALHGTDIKTNTLTLENSNISGKVPNNQEIFSFIDEITVADGATFSVSTDINGSNVIRTKTVNLAIGDNTYYILVESGKDIKLYNVSIRRRPIYTVAFNENGGTEVQAQQVEEDGFATEPTSERAGYTFDKWDWNFGNAITDNTTVTASWNVISYNITYDLNGGENPVDNPATYTIEDEIVLSAPTKVGYTGTWSNGGQIAKGSTGNKHFVATYTINQYNVSVSQSINNSCDHTRGGVYDYASQITLSANPYLGYDFVGWYDGDTLLSEENTFVFVVPARDCNITAKTTAKAEMQNFEFSSTLDSCTITGLKDKSITDLVIPDFVTSIGGYAFYNCSGLTSITIPDSVTSIGNYAFNGCTGLTSVTIPDSVTSIDRYAFGNCSGLTSATIGNGVTSIGSGAFYGCSGLTSIMVSENNSAFASVDGILYDKNKTKIVYIPDAIKGAISIPDSVTSIDSYAFYNCSGLTSITIGSGVTSIGNYAFYNCTDLTSILIQDSVTSVGKGAFKGCSSLESITIPFVGASKTASNGYDQVFGYIFGYTITSAYSTVDGATYQYSNYDQYSDYDKYYYYIPSSLKSVVIGDGATSIPSSAFYNCKRLTSITIGNGVTSIGVGAFAGCGVTNIYYTGDIAEWCGISELGNLMWYGSSSTTLYIGGNKVEGELIIPNGVTSIPSDAFRYCIGLTSVTIPDSVTSIGSSAFYNCTGLTRVTIGSGVTSIGGSAFSGCTGLTSIVIPDYVTSIDTYAFYNCTGLTSVTIGSVVTSIGEYAFRDCIGLTSINWNATACTSAGSSSCPILEGCTNLTTVDMSENVTIIPSHTFYGCSGLTSISGSLGIISTVVNQAKPSSFAANITNGQSIDSSVLSGCTELTRVTISNSVTSIGECAFDGCTGLTSITISDSVTSIGRSAFCDCTGLTSITIPDSVTSIGDYAFRGCYRLTRVTIGSGVTSIGSGAFYGCSGLTSITFPDGVTSIGEHAFYECTGLKNIYYTGDVAGWCGISSLGNLMYSGQIQKTLYIGGTKVEGELIIPDSVKSIPSSAFRYCIGLTSVVIPDSVTSIGDHAFYGCKGLSEIIIGNSVTSIGDCVFYDCTGLTDINYKGTKAQWNAISKGYYWNYDVPNSCRIVCTDGTI